MDLPYEMICDDAGEKAKALEGIFLLISIFIVRKESASVKELYL